MLPQYPELALPLGHTAPKNQLRATKLGTRLIKGAAALPGSAAGIQEIQPESEITAVPLSSQNIMVLNSLAGAIILRLCTISLICIQ